MMMMKYEVHRVSTGDRTVVASREAALHLARVEATKVRDRLMDTFQNDVVRLSYLSDHDAYEVSVRKSTQAVACYIETFQVLPTFGP